MPGRDICNFLEI
uniref:Uncharacterized protein n=1 Tax=Lepeophtheirus salmonis TaxID=72036 RepID=A0A0K2TGU7_LEPSM